MGLRMQCLPEVTEARTEVCWLSHSRQVRSDETGPFIFCETRVNHRGFSKARPLRTLTSSDPGYCGGAFDDSDLENLEMVTFASMVKFGVHCGEMGLNQDTGRALLSSGRVLAVNTSTVVLMYSMNSQ